jgi:hypothetical protein
MVPNPKKLLEWRILVAVNKMAVVARNMVDKIKKFAHSVIGRSCILIFAMIKIMRDNKFTS